MSTYKSYLERFNKSKTNKRDTSADAKLNTEKETYTQFLEVQLDRISQALVQIDSYNERLELTSQQVVEIEDKIGSTNKLVKLLQSFSEGQESDNAKFDDRIKSIEQSQQSVTSSMRNFVSFDQYSTMLSRMDDMEKKFASLQDNALLKNKVVGEPNSLFSLAIEKQLERYSKDIEYKIMDQLTAKNDYQFQQLQVFEDKLSEYNEKFSQDIAADIKTLESRMNDFFKRSGDKGYANDEGSPSFNDLRNDLYNKIELLMNEMKNTVPLKEFDKLVQRVENHFDQSPHGGSFRRSSKSPNKFSNDRLDELDQKIADLELIFHRNNYQNDPKLIEDITNLQINVKQLEVRVEDLWNEKKGQGYASNSISGASINHDIRDVEKRLADQLSSGIDRFSGLLRKYIDKQRSVEDSVEDMKRRMTVGDDRSFRRTDVTNANSDLADLSAISDQRGKSQYSSASPKENPFLRAKITSANRFDSLVPNSRSPKTDPYEYVNDEQYMQTSFGNRERKLSRGFSNTVNIEQVPQRDNPRSGKKASTKKGTKTKKLSAKSRSQSYTKSANTSFISNNSKVAGTPTSRRKTSVSSKKSNAKSRSMSPKEDQRTGLSGNYLTPSKRSFSRNAKKQNDSLVSSSKKSKIREMQHKIDQERRLREEKIKKLVKKSKAETDTPKFTIRTGAAQQKSTKRTNLSSRSSRTPNSATSEGLTKQLKYDYNFTTKENNSKNSNNPVRQSKKYKQLDNLYNMMSKN